jgi:hypothetical protein
MLNFLSDPLDTPDGPMVLMDAKDLTDDDLVATLDGLASTMAQLGVRSGVIEVPSDSGVLDSLEFVDEAIVGAAYLPPDEATLYPPVSLPGTWSEPAAEWLRSAGLSLPLTVDLVGQEARISWSELDAYLRARNGSTFRISCGSVDNGLRTIASVGGQYSRLALMACGARSGWPGLAEEANVMAGILQQCSAELSWAYVTPIDTVSQFGGGERDLPYVPMYKYDWPGGGYLNNLSDVSVLDAFWFQILSPGHLDRLSSSPALQPVANGRAVLTIGEFSDWVDSKALPSVRAAGRAMLSRCFFDDNQGRQVFLERKQVRRGR